MAKSLREFRTLTTGGDQQFNQSNERHLYKLRSTKRNIDSILMDIGENPILDLELAATVKGDLVYHMDIYNQLADAYLTFLHSYRTQRSQSEESLFRVTLSTLKAKVSTELLLLSSILPEERPNNEYSEHNASQSSYVSEGSHTSRTSRSGSSRSRSSRKSTTSVSSELIKQSVKLETAKTRLKYAKEEAELLRKEAVLKAEQNVLSVKREVEEAESSLKAVKKVLDLDFDDLGESYEPPPIDTKPPSSKKLPKSDYDIQETVEQRTEKYVSSLESLSSLSLRSPTEQGCGKDNMITDTNNNKTHNPFSEQDKTDVQNIAKFLVKKDFITSRLIAFDDQPSRYVSWKLSFKHIMLELDASPLEQLDLLIKYLGPSSQQQAQSIRCANTIYPDTALRLIWERLDSRFGSPEMIESSLHSRLVSFPKLTPNNRMELFELADLAAEIDSIRKDERFYTTFAYFDSSLGVNRFVQKLPYNIQEKWTTKANSYKADNNGSYPQFSFFVSFLQDIAKVRNDPGFLYDNLDSKPTNVKPTRDSAKVRRLPQISTYKTDIGQNEAKPDSNQKGLDLCPLHGTNHKLNNCRAFRAKPLSERLELLKNKGLCFRCCGPKKHYRDKCKEVVKCSVCSSSKHPSALHVDPEPQRNHEGEKKQEQIVNSCTKICDSINVTSKSCAKIVLVKVFHPDQPDYVKTVYCLIDDQSNRTLATSSLFDFFGESSTETEYVISSCAGKFVTSGRRAQGYVVKSIDTTVYLNLPTLIECNEIPNNREEIPSPIVASSYPHMMDIARFIPNIDPEIEIELLIGRDLISAHHVLEHRIGYNELPYAQRLPLGWIIIGNVCLGQFHGPEVVNVNKTVILSNGRPTLMLPCDSELSFNLDPVFIKTSLDEKQGLSIEDQAFLDIMSAGFHKLDSGQWSAPLPFKLNKPTLENNKALAERRAKSFDKNLISNHEKRAHVLEFMQRLFDSGHAEKAKQLSPDIECWYLPMFAVYHPKKPDSVRVVFDSSAKHHGLSLNDVMLKGPDMYNSLLGILLRFRKEAYAITVDIEQMFHNFKVTDDHRRFLRFLWHEENNFDKPLTEFQMSVHVFGNSPSPAVATYGLRKTVELADSDVQNFITDNFYVDDGLTSCVSEEKAINLVQKTKRVLHENGRLRLHKVASNSRTVIEAFESDDLAKNLNNLDLGSSSLPVQRSLGLLWDTELDEFTFSVSSDIKPYTRRGVLSTVNSLYDPLGLAAPVVIRGKLLLREMLSTDTKVDWDDPLPEALKNQWETWILSLCHLERLRIPRKYNGLSFVNSVRREVHIFSDASTSAIAAVAYLILSDGNECKSSFLLGKAKVAPTHGHTVPRLELCAAVLAVEISDIIRDQLQISSSDFYYHTDSRVVLGYINNETRRFFVYVGNRVSRIRASSRPIQWSYVPTTENPADLATRSINTLDLPTSLWIKGPNLLSLHSEQSENDHHLVDPDNDKELRLEVQSNKTEIDSKPQENVLDAKRFTSFSNWTRLVRCIARIKSYIRCHQNVPCNSTSSELIKNAESIILKAVQHEAFRNEVRSLQDNKPLPKSSSLLTLAPFLDHDGLLRVGGRLRNLESNTQLDMSCHPIILPKNHHVSLLLIRHFHESVHHQGRHLTLGAIRSGGFWIIGSKRTVASLINNCITCRKLRGKFEWQIMADLPEDRLRPSPPFSYVGVDTFGPWQIHFRRTRGGSANQKRWALLFTCLVTRGIHIEVIEEMSSSSFINALRRFVAIRGPVTQFRSDRGTNFIGANSELSIDPIFMGQGAVKDYLSKSRASWIFNPPYAHHMGGTWERLIGVARRILDGMLLENNNRHSTHEILVTFLAEVTAIINSRPLLPVSTDPECPSVLSPTALLTMKTSPEVVPFPSLNPKDMLKAHWKYVQGLAQEFWRRWQNDYLHELQTRSKWMTNRRNLKVGDLVLMKDQDTPRICWPMGLVEKTYPSSDGKIRKVDVTIVKDGRRLTYSRPLTELVTLLEVD